MVEEELSDAESVCPEQRPLSRSDYKIEKLIGEGANASVYKIRMVETGEVYALKVMKKSDIVKRNLLRLIQAERRILVSSGLTFRLRSRAHS